MPGLDAAKRLAEQHSGHEALEESAGSASMTARTKVYARQALQAQFIHTAAALHLALLRRLRE